MNGKVLALIGAIVVALAATATAIDLARQDGPAPTSWSTAISVESRRNDPLRRSLVRCRELGEAAMRDADCLAAWAQNRRRFLGQPEGR